MSALEYILVAVVGYLVGSIPFAVLIGRIHGVDILKEGSGSPGATNVKRSVGRMAGNLCFVVDFMKGLIAAGWPQLPFLGFSNPLVLGIVGLLAAVIGHSFSVFISFRGGKGVSTTIGGLLAIMPMVLLVAIVVWAIVYHLTRYVSLASIILGVSLPLLATLFKESVQVVGLCVFISLFIIVRHRSNIKRLIAGTEDRFSKESS